MEVKSQADIINSVADGAKISCSKCNMPNDATLQFCQFCGTTLPHIKAAQEATKAQAKEDIKTTAEPKTMCQKCNMPNDITSQFCIFCGTTLIHNTQPSTLNSNGAVFSTISETMEKKNENVIEEVSVFAEGLPSWSLEPPQIMVRRKRGK